MKPMPRDGAMSTRNRSHAAQAKSGRDECCCQGSESTYFAQVRIEWSAVRDREGMAHQWDAARLSYATDVALVPAGITWGGE